MSNEGYYEVTLDLAGLKVAETTKGAIEEVITADGPDGSDQIVLRSDEPFTIQAYTTGLNETTIESAYVEV